jgi:hypothetical protein
MYTTESKEKYVLRKLQSSLTSIESWCERWNIKISVDKTQAIAQMCIGRDSSYTEGNEHVFVKEVQYFGVFFYIRVTWRKHIDSIVTKALRTYIRMYSLLKIDRLSAKSILTLYKASMRSKMTYVCPVWECAVDNHLLKLQRLQNRVLRTIGNLPKCTQTCALHWIFQIPYVYNYIKICRKSFKLTIR